MPRVNWDGVNDAEDYSPLPDGEYLCTLSEVADALRTQGGDEMWELRFTVAEGEYSGRTIFDRISFGRKALPRVKLLCSRLGLDVTGEWDVRPHVIRGRSVWVTVETETYTDKKMQERERNTVPFAGYRKVEENGSAAPEPEDDLPF